MIRLEAGSATLVGQVRQANEDALVVTEDLAAVADGMGGHRGGEVASALAVEVLGAASGRRSVEDLVAAVHLANRRVNEDAEENDDLRGMGTTVCLVGIVHYDGHDRLAVLNVGDSRVYLRAGGELVQLTEDHSLVETLVREGRLTPEEAEVHPQRNVLTRVIGVEPLVVVDAWLLDPCDGDRLMLCSDGLFNELPVERLGELLAEEEPPEVLARRLAAEADAAGGRDNITVVVLDVSDTGHPPAPLADRYRRITTPAVDLSDLDEDGPRTEVALAVVAAADPDRSAAAADADAVPDTDADPDARPADADDAADDPGGAADLVEPAGPGALAGPGEGPAGDGEDDGRSHRSAWRTGLFTLAVVAVLALAVGAVLTTARRGWFVGEQAGNVAIFRGQPGGVLWIQPTLEEPSDLAVDSLTLAAQDDVRAGKQQATLADARRYVENLTAATTTTTTTTTSTTTTTTTTTTAPVAPAAPPVPGPAPPAPAPVPAGP